MRTQAIAHSARPALEAVGSRARGLLTLLTSSSGCRAKVAWPLPLGGALQPGSRHLHHCPNKDCCSRLLSPSNRFKQTHICTETLLRTDPFPQIATSTPGVCARAYCSRAHRLQLPSGLTKSLRRLLIKKSRRVGKQAVRDRMGRTSSTDPVLHGTCTQRAHSTAVQVFFGMQVAAM